MSGKIKSKDLSYDQSLPPFLQRLHAQKAGRGDTDRHERDITRPKRAKDPNDDDGPTVVDESGETLTKDEVQHLTGKSDDTINAIGNEAGDGNPQASSDPVDTQSAENAKELKRPEQKLTDGTAQKKRKAAKVVGDEEDGGQGSGEQATKIMKKTKKKAKAIKLAFDADDGLSLIHI